MVIRFWAVGRTSASVRDALITFIDNNQRELPEEFPIWMGKEKVKGRNPGWAKAYSRVKSNGVINFEWNQRSRILECQAVSKGDAHPYLLLGEFMSVLLRLPRKAVKSVHIEPDSSRH